MYLRTHSYYSLRYGTLSIEDIVKLARLNNIHALALTDINNSSGIPDFIRECLHNQVKPIAGIDFFNDDRHLYTGIAANREGLRELNEYLSNHNLNKNKLPAIAPVFQNAYIIYPFGAREPNELRDNERIGIRPREVRKLIRASVRQDQSKVVMLHPVSFADKNGYEIHRNFRAIDKNILISQLKEQHLAHPDETMMPPDMLLAYFEDYPVIVQNTRDLVASCNIEMNLTSYKNKQTFTGSRYDDQLLLEKLACDGLAYRYGKNNKVAVERVKKELDIILKLGFASYFLITWDIIRYSMSRGFYHVGRGSGANSVTAYCLRITDVDPIELNLYFERFLNPKRSSPPDFDIDYSWQERDEVQDYIFKRYGKNHTALLGAMSTFKGKSILRELGKVYGLPKEEIDSFIAYPDNPMNHNNITRHIHQIASQVVDYPNLRSIHAGGILISEEPIYYYTALDLPPKGFPTTQWDMYVAEDIGFEKLDILSQRGIGHIKDAAEIVRENRGVSVDVHQVEKFKNDPKVKAQLKAGETNGCFYIESPAMRGLLKKLHCDNYLTLVAASSIIRPGVARSGMMKEYIKRFHDPGGFSYLHPVMEEQLKETYGVMVYQEDVLKVCHHFAGLDLADADVLRRAMSGKYRSKKEFQRIVQRFFNNCHESGYPEAITKEVWRQIESFAGYSFSKAHSASYAVESFQSLYLKAHYPLEFMVSVINNFGGFYQGRVYFSEARRWGGRIMLPCVNHGRYLTRVKGKDIYIGFVHLQNLEVKIAKGIEKERERNGDFKSLEDFVTRLPVGIEQLLILVRIGAFRFTGKSKGRLMWEAHLLLGKKNKPSVHYQSLFEVKQKKFTLPKLEHSALEDAYDELELLEFPVSLTSFDMLKTRFRGELLAKDLRGNVGKTVRVVGELVTIKYARTIRKEIMNFACFTDATGEFFDTTHFPASLKQYPFRGQGVYLILGKIVEEFGFPSIEVQKMAKLPFKPNPKIV